ncbi:MAG: ATP-binding protein [Candidatus Acidulodesulfobacterium sp.]
MGETRVNLHHLLEDIRDSYPFPQEEVIITELVANSLDSHASDIRFIVDSQKYILTVIDNGKGMNKKELDGYHNIASTTKTRGMGIGFAGVGAKLSLLIAKEVVTETANGNFRGATKWKLENDEKAPWKYITPVSEDSKLINSPHGTAVSIFFKSNNSELLNPEFIKKTIQKHFYTILDAAFQTALRFIYKNGINFYINEEKISLSEMMQFEKSNAFKIHFGKKGKPVGVGFVRKYKNPLDEEKRGIAISTCGKVIKHGWDWLGISARNPDYISGVVEMPGLSLILTTNKADFLKDTTSLQKYYRYRKAVQEVIEPILKEFGEINESREKPTKEMRPLEKEIRGILDNMLKDFPELDPLFGRRKKLETDTGVLDDTSVSESGTAIEKNSKENAINSRSNDETQENENCGLPNLDTDEQKNGLPQEGKRKPPGLMIGFYDNKDSNELGKIEEGTVWINNEHPAFKRIAKSGGEKYHIVVSTAFVLSGYLQEQKSLQAFINRFLSDWGKEA